MPRRRGPTPLALRALHESQVRAGLDQAYSSLDEFAVGSWPVPRQVGRRAGVVLLMGKPFGLNIFPEHLPLQSNFERSLSHAERGNFGRASGENCIGLSIGEKSIVRIYPPIKLFLGCDHAGAKNYPLLLRSV